MHPTSNGRILRRLVAALTLAYSIAFSLLYCDAQSCGSSYVTTLIESTACGSGSTVSYDPKAKNLYISCDNSGIVRIPAQVQIPPATFTPLTTSVNCGSGTGVEYLPNNSGLVVAACRSGIMQIDNTTVSMLISTTQCSLPYAVWEDTASNTLYSICRGTGVMATPFGTNGTIGDPTNTTLTIVSSQITGRPFSVFPDMLDASLLYIATDNGVFLYNKTSSAITTIANSTVCSGARQGVHHAASDSLYVTCSNMAITRFSRIGANIFTSKAIVPQKNCSTPSNIVLDPFSSTLIYISCYGGGGVIAIDTRDGDQPVVTPVVTVGVCLFPGGIVVADRGNTLYTSCRASSMSLITITGQTARAVVDFTSCDSGLLHKGYWYFGCAVYGILIVDAATFVLLDTLVPNAICSPVGLAVDESNDILFAACTDTGLVQVSLRTRKYSSLLNRACGNGNGISFDRFNGVVLAGCSSASGVLVISNSTVPRSIGNTSICTAGTIAQVIASDITPGLVFAVCHSGFSLYPLFMAIQRLANGSSTTTVLAPSASCESSEMFVSNDVVYIACRTTGKLLAMYPNGTGTTLATFTLEQCSGARSIYRDPQIGDFYISCDSGILHIDLQTQEVAPYVTTDACLAVRKVFYKDPGSSILLANCADSGVFAFSKNFKCWAGSYWSLGSCLPCPVHTFRPAGDLQHFGKCQPCPNGFIAPTPGSAECTRCGAGTYESNRLCLLCETGKSQSFPNATSCVPCEIGKYAASPGLASCLDCGIGTAKNVSGSVTCDLCLPGEFQTRNGSVTCDKCDAGRYSVASGSSYCQDCAPGFFSDNQGTVTCFPCNSGSASNITGLNRPCDGCAAGYYQAALGQTSCNQCPPRFFSEQANSSSCTRCPNQVNEDRTACTVTTCEENSYFDDVSEICELCPLSTYSSSGGRCSYCPVNSFTPAVGSGCASCDGVEGLTCNNGIASVVRGYWAFLSDRDFHIDWQGRAYPLFRTAPCPFCPGSMLQAGNSSQTNFTTINYCSAPRLNSVNNTLCANCEEGYLAWGDSCLNCDRANGGLMFGYFVLSFALVLFIFYSSSSTSSAGATAVLLFFLQTAALEMGSLVSTFLGWIQVVNLDTKTAATCLAPWTAYDQTLFALFIPLILIAELMFIAVMHFILFQLARDWKPADNQVALFFLTRIQQFSFNDYRVGCLGILLFCYTQVTTTTLRYLYCIDVQSVRLNFNAPTINCDSSEYKTYLIPVLLTLILYVIGLPLIAFLTLWRNRESLFLPLDSDAVKSSEAIRTFLQHWAPFYKMNRPGAWFWQCWLLVRRSCYVVISVLLIQQPAIRDMSFTFVSFASLMLHQIAMPYDSKSLNQLESISYTLLICISLLLTGFPAPSTAVQTILFLLVVPTAAGMICFILYQRYRLAQEWLQQRKAIASQAATNGGADVVEMENYTHNPSLSIAAPAEGIAPVRGVMHESILQNDSIDSEQSQL